MQRLQRSIMRRKKGRQRSSRRRMQSLQGCVKKIWNGRHGSKRRRIIRLLICTKSCMNKMKGHLHMLWAMQYIMLLKIKGRKEGTVQVVRMIESQNHPLEGGVALLQLLVLEGKALLNGLRAGRATRGQNEEGIRRGGRFGSQTLLRQSVQSKAQKLMTQVVTTETLLVVKQWWSCTPNQLLCSRKPWGSMETQDDEVPKTIGTLIHHHDNHGYTFMGTTVSEVGGSSRHGVALADASVQVGAQGRRVEVQTDASVHGNTKVQGSSTRTAAVSARMSRNPRLPVGIVRIEVKGEMRDKFPARVGLKHDIPTARNVLCFYENMLRSTTSYRDN